MKKSEPLGSLLSAVDSSSVALALLSFTARGHEA
jgi:hypothetical protein